MGGGNISAQGGSGGSKCSKTYGWVEFMKRAEMICASWFGSTWRFLKRLVGVGDGIRIQRRGGKAGLGYS